LFHSCHGKPANNQNEVFLAASPIRPVTTTLPIILLQKTVPIYSKEVFNDQFQYKSKVKGWAYVRTGVYWCDKAFDKGAKGGKVWSVDLDEWRNTGRRGEGWGVELRELEAPPVPDEEEGEEVDIDDDDDAAEDGEEEEEKEEMELSTPRKRKTAISAGTSTGTGTPKKKRRTTNSTATATKDPLAKKGRARKVPHPKSSTSNLPATIAPEDLPTDPYQRALRLLHVGATPDSLPCREEEFVDVLSRVEEGVEGGGGGCLCKFTFPSPVINDQG
jgi:origin recognition complex subunit 1